MQENFNTQKRDYELTANPMTWGLITGTVFFYDHRAKSNGLFPLKIRITYKHDRTYYDTGYSMTVEQWKSFKTGRGDVREARIAIQAQMEIMGSHIKDMNREGNFSFELLKKKLGRGSKNDVFAAFEDKIKDLRKKGHVGNAVVYECALSSLKNYYSGRELRLSKITKTWLENYDEEMRKDKKSITTRSMYLRCLRAIINASGVASPFGKDKFQVRSGGSRKMALTKPQIKDVLMNYALIPGSTTDKMRDLFYFSYLASGMNVKDLILLRWDKIQNGELTFIRAKTARQNSRERIIRTPILPQMQTIIDKWGNRESEYIFGYVNSSMTPDEVRGACQNVTRLINKHLKIITDATGLPHVSTYTARHSFATNLLKSHAPMPYISNQMGHSNISVTQAYFDGFDSEDREKYNSSLTD